LFIYTSINGTVSGTKVYLVATASNPSYATHGLVISFILGTQMVFYLSCWLVTGSTLKVLQFVSYSKQAVSLKVSSEDIQEALHHLKNLHSQMLTSVNQLGQSG
jgi:hypothetical protein